MTAWLDLPILLKLAIGWLSFSVLFAIAWSRWFRWLRGDFDKDE
jgi:hypothetical protein